MARKLKVHYEEVNGKDWSDAAAAIRIAGQALATAKSRMESARETVKGMLRENKSKAVIHDGIKFSLSLQSRRSLDKLAFAAAHPNINLDDFYKAGSESEVLKIFGGDNDDSGGFDDQLMSLHDSLIKFVDGDFSDESALKQFDKLRNDTELYLRQLNNESDQLEKTLKMAHKTLSARIGMIALPTADSVKADK